MANRELVQVLDFILNRCKEEEVDVVAEALVRRKKDLALFAGTGLPDPNIWARKTAEALGAGSSGRGLGSVHGMVEDLILDMIKREVPDLAEEDLKEILKALLPSGESKEKKMSATLVSQMVEQFLSFSQGLMGEAEDAALREEFGAWPERYWESLPPVVRSILKDHLDGLSTEGEFRRRLRTAIDMSCAED